MKRHGTSLVIAAALLLLLPALPAVAQDGDFSGQFLIGFRTVDVGGHEAKYKEDYNYEEGPRLLDLSFDLTPSDPELRAFADLIEVDVANVGGDPYETIRLGIRKYGNYAFNYNRTKSAYFYEDILVPPAEADVRLSNGGDFHHFDFERVRDRASLDIDINPRAKFTFGFDRFTRVGESTTTLDIQRDEFELDKPLDESLYDYNAGFQYAWDKVTLVLEERYREYDNPVEIFLPGFSEGENTTNAANLDFYFLDQPYQYTSYRHTVRVLANPSPRFSIRGSASLETLDLDVDAEERLQGTGFSGAPVASDTVGSGQIDRDIDLFDLDFSYLINQRWSVIGSVYQRNLDQTGDFEFGSLDNRGLWEIDTTGLEAGLQVAVNPDVTVSGGVIWESRDVTHGATDDAAAGVDRETVTTDHNGYFARLGWRASKAFRLTAEAEQSSFDDPFALAAPTDRTRFRVRGNYKADNGFFATGSYLRTDYENNDSGWDAATTTAVVRGGYQTGEVSVSLGYGLVDIDRTILQVSTVGPFDIDYQAESDFFDGRLVWNATEAWTVGGNFRLYQNDGSFALQRDDLYGWVRYAFEKGYLLQVGYRTIDYDEDAANFDDYDADIAEFAIGYRW